MIPFAERVVHVLDVDLRNRKDDRPGETRKLEGYQTSTPNIPERFSYR
jgi:hypothetical protein